MGTLLARDGEKQAGGDADTINAPARTAPDLHQSSEAEQEKSDVMFDEEKMLWTYSQKSPSKRTQQQQQPMPHIAYCPKGKRSF